MVGGSAAEVAVTADWRARKRAATRARITTATFALIAQVTEPAGAPHVKSKTPSECPAPAVTPPAPAWRG